MARAINRHYPCIKDSYDVTIASGAGRGDAAALAKAMELCGLVRRRYHCASDAMPVPCSSSKKIGRILVEVGLPASLCGLIRKRRSSLAVLIDDVAIAYSLQQQLGRSSHGTSWNEHV